MIHLILTTTRCISWPKSVLCADSRIPFDMTPKGKLVPNSNVNSDSTIDPEDRYVALIAGGTSGVGLACARTLLSQGLRFLTVVGRDGERARCAAETLSADYPLAHILAESADVGGVEGAQRAVASTLAEFGCIDLMICSTVPSDVAPELLALIPLEEIERTLTQISLPPILLTRAVLPTMRTKGAGSIVLVASDAAKVPTPGESIVGAAMAAITMFTRTSALELKRDGIRVNCVTPSLIADTPTSERVLAGGFSAKIFKKATALAALGVPTADEVANLVCHLAGPQSARVTGQVVSINGGISTG